MLKAKEMNSQTSLIDKYTKLMNECKLKIDYFADHLTSETMPKEYEHINKSIAAYETNNWSIEGVDSGTLDNGVGTVTFANIPNLEGGDQIDNFSFATLGSITGLINSEKKYSNHFK